MNIVLIAEKGHYRDWVGKTYCDILMYYTKYSRNRVTLMYSDRYSSCNKDIMKSLSPNLICFFETNRLTVAKQFDYVFDLNVPIFYCGLDLFYFNDCTNCPNIQKCNGIIHFSKTINLENSYKLHFPNKIHTHFDARFINSNRFKNYGKEKKYDILIYGTRKYMNLIENHIPDQNYVKKYESIYNKTLNKNEGVNFYNLRSKLENLLIKNTHKYRLKILNETCIYNPLVANEALSQLINESHLTLACRTRADIAMAKYFEIPASYSAILGDIPSDYEYLFKDNIVEVTEWMTDEEILNIIDKALEDKEKLWEMTKRLGDRVHLECNLNSGTKNMDDVFESLI